MYELVPELVEAVVRTTSRSPAAWDGDFIRISADQVLIWMG